MVHGNIIFHDVMGEGDHCTMSWNACCEDTDKLKESGVSVQFVDSDGVPVINPIKGLSEVVVTGPNAGYGHLTI